MDAVKTDFRDELKYFIVSPVITEKEYVADIANHLQNPDLNVFYKPNYKLEPVSLLDVKGLLFPKQYDITWPFILMLKINDEKLRVICHQIIITSYSNEPDLETRLFNLFYTAYLTVQFELGVYFASEKLDLEPPEFSEIEDFFDWKKMAEEHRSAVQ